MFRGFVFKSTKFLQKRVPFKLADIGEGISEVQIIQWHVKEGSVIKQFEKIAEVQSDKATVEITSRYEGIVKKIHYNVNDMAKVGEPLIDIETEEHADDSSSKKVSDKAIKSLEKASGPIVEDKSHTSMYQMMPSVRKYVLDNNVDLSKLNLDRKSKITKEDIQAALNRSNNSSTLQFTEFQMNPVQKAMVRAMEASLKIPHFGYSDEYRMDNLVKVRAEYKEKISIMPFIVRAICLALKDFPTINAHFADGKLMCAAEVNLGIAVDTPHGLVVPVLKGVQSMNSIEEIARKLSELTDRAKRNKLHQEDFEGATFTISNIGSIGGTYASPVIVSPQVCIVAMGKMRVEACFNEKAEVEAHNMAAFSWSADHRAINGATMARFSNRVKELIEDPSKLNQ